MQTPQSTCSAALVQARSTQSNPLRKIPRRSGPSDATLLARLVSLTELGTSTETILLTGVSETNKTVAVSCNVTVAPTGRSIKTSILPLPLAVGHRPPLVLMQVQLA